MQIPKRFKLLGQTINVVWDACHFIERTDAAAFASYRLKEIQMNPNVSYQTEEAKQQTFLHELVHFILYYSESSYQGKTDYMHQDEGFVDLTASLLHQALTTMEYE